MGDDCNLGDAHHPASTPQGKGEKAGARAPGNSLPGSGYPPLATVLPRVTDGLHQTYISAATRSVRRCRSSPSGNTS
jgi:hypothetical protein